MEKSMSNRDNIIKSSYDFAKEVEQIIKTDFNMTFENEKKTVEYIAINWKKLFTQILNDQFKWELNSKGIDDLFKWECDNIFNFNSNEYKLLELHKIEIKYKSLKQLIKDFIDDMVYCSDRFSIDRLFRCHWKFTDMLNKFLSERIIKCNYNNKIIFYQKIYLQLFKDIENPTYITICKDCFKILKLKLRKCDSIDKTSTYENCEICNFNNHDFKYIYKIKDPKKLSFQFT